jgi:hypothetical protein
LHARFQLSVVFVHRCYKRLEVTLQQLNFGAVLALNLANALLKQFDGGVVLLEFRTVDVLLALQPLALLASFLECLVRLLAFGGLAALQTLQLLLHRDNLLLHVLLLHANVVNLLIAQPDLVLSFFDRVASSLEPATLRLGFLQKFLYASEFLEQFAWRKLSTMYNVTAMLSPTQSVDASAKF